MKQFCIFVVLFAACTGMVFSGDRVSIYDIQYTTDPSGNSPYAGQIVTVTGFVSAIYWDGFFLAEAPGAWHAIYVYVQQSHGPAIGDEVELTGTVVEQYNMTQIDTVTDFSLLSTGNSVISTSVDTQSAAQEKYESILITVHDVTVQSLEGYGEWYISDGSAPILVDDLNDFMVFPQVGNYLESITGTLWYSYGVFKIEPRNTMDFEGPLIPHYALGGHIVTMNDSREIIQDGYVEIKGDRIIGITTEMPGGITVVETESLIFPGLIDAHNHPVYNVLSEIPFPCKFADRDEWHNHPMYDDFNDQYGDIRDYGGGSYAQSTNLWKLAEVRALCAGTTMIQGRNCNGHSEDPYGHQGMGINNAERFPSRIFSSTFPMDYQDDWQNTKRYECWDRFVIHLSEGYSSGALAEFNEWESWGMLDWRTSIIHGVAYGPPEWQKMADENANLIWSPFSNWILYEHTADVPGALAVGVNVALAPDWTESGMDNILDEMRFANVISWHLWGGYLTAAQLADMVTRNAAYALGMQEWAGQVALNYQADLMVIPGDPENPYQSLLEAQAQDVMLTVVSGRPMYGDPVFMDQFTFLQSVEDITICDVPKRLALRINAHGIPDSDDPFSDVMTTLEAAYAASQPKLCEFTSFDPCVLGTTPTPLPTSIIPTFTPTPVVATRTPTPTGNPTFTPTPQECDELGVKIWMPSHDFGAGDPCSLEARVCNPQPYAYENIPLFVLLDVYGTYFFAPSFGEYDYYTLDTLDPGLQTVTVIPEFPWPAGIGAADGILVYGAMTNTAQTQLFGSYDVFSFGWH